MKLAIHRRTCQGGIVQDRMATPALATTHRIVDLTFSHEDPSGGRHYVDVWGGTWRLSETGETECTVGAMEKWA